MKAKINRFFHRPTGSLSYVVSDPATNDCAIIDPVLDFDAPSGEIHYDSANELIAFVQAQNLALKLLIETHVHADHLSAAPYIQESIGGKIGISEQITVVQDEFGKLFNEGTQFERDGSQFDILFTDGYAYQIGELKGYAMSTPGHTPACMTHVIEDCAFVGDTVFMPEAGTARTDFPGGSASQLYQSIQKILSLPEDTQLYLCHDYPPEGREAACSSTVKEQKRHNIHIGNNISESEFVSMREARDSTLDLPKLIYPSLQTNMRAGRFPDAEDNETVYLKTPISGLRKQA